MTETNTIARTLHDTGLAAWFGGSLMGAVGLNGASGEVTDPSDRTRVANAGWGRWTPVNLAAIAAHVVGSLQLTRENAGRLKGQKGVATTAAVKTGVTAAALAATAYSRVLGQKVMDAEAAASSGSVSADGLPSQDATTPVGGVSDEVASAQRQLKALQWAIPVLTGALLVLNARMGEQQRPTQVAAGLVRRLLPIG
ncbi:hypothetical protein BH23ACT7_BH23ACT7_26830 [soil metagenome]|jgi:hypothetical protein|nr:hypothetical protein [Euzebyaceae bacterium]